MTDKKDLKIGLALSGGGVRAAVFHLGLVRRLAVDDLLENVTYLSTVSGGSLGTGLVYSSAGNEWPASSRFRDDSLPRVKRLMTTKRLQLRLIVRAILEAFYKPSSLLGSRAGMLSKVMQNLWGINGLVKDLPKEPMWYINATTYESGRNWRFSPDKMGDYVAHYVENPPIPVSDAMAASAGFPGLIGPLLLNCNKYDEWFKWVEESPDVWKKVPTEPKFRKVHLWDGGVYDNNGMEALYKIGADRFSEDDINFLIVSSATPKLEDVEYACLLKRMKRLLSITMYQVRGLRARSVVDFYNDHENSGTYLQIGNTAADILRASKNFTEEQIEQLTEGTLSDKQVKKVAKFPTTLRRVNDEEFELLCRHGWEVADYTLIAYCGDIFSHLPYPGKINI